MNIFILDLDTRVAASYHNDKHVVKMILETAQLLCNVHYSVDKDAPYKKTHYNHPCSIWARNSLSNYIWLCNLGKDLCKEYTERYGKIHKTEEVIDWLIKNKPDIPDIGLTPFAQAMPDKYKDPDPVIAYRKYYVNEKLRISNWKNKTPEFLKDEKLYYHEVPEPSI